MTDIMSWMLMLREQKVDGGRCGRGHSLKRVDVTASGCCGVVVVVMVEVVAMVETAMVAMGTNFDAPSCTQEPTFSNTAALHCCYVIDVSGGYSGWRW